MFSLFRKKENNIKITDRVFLSETGKLNAIKEKISSATYVIITWFEDSYQKIADFIKANHAHAELFLAREVSMHHIENKAVLFFEHHPLATKETELFDRLQLKEAVIYSSIDEPFFLHFGGGKIGVLMTRMGASENEVIEHPLISSSIRNAQKKIAEKMIIDQSARSQAEWLSRNLP